MRALLLLLSGFAALVYQVLWVRELGLLVGGTAQAAALTIAIFFAGMASGGWFWGRRSRRVRAPLALFGWLEVGVGLAALAHFGLIDVYHAVYPRLFQSLAHLPALDLLLKALIAASILFPASFLMGGTLPAMVAERVRNPTELARHGSSLYALNTLGGAAGALSAGFFLPPHLGFRNTYLLAVGLDVAIGLCALWLARHAGPVERRRAGLRSLTAGPALPLTAVPPRIWLTAFASGFSALGIEVIWTRLFAQVLQNSVYTYALVLVSFLLALTLGAALANRLCRLRRLGEDTVLLWVLALAGISVTLSPWGFHAVTGGLGYVGAGRDWWGYLFSVARVSVLVMLPPAILLGAVLPYLLRLLQPYAGAPGRLIGTLMAVDTIGAITGALVAGFVILPRVGATRGMLLLGSVYLLVLAMHLLARPGWKRRALAAGVLAGAVVTLRMPADRLRVVRVQAHRGERLVEVIEGARATAAVLSRDDHLLIRVNNHYTLGGTGALESERNQALIPMMLHPAPKRVFFLGMGTGITAGAALRFPVERIVVSEILPEVVALARSHFGPWTGGLFEDPRVRIVADDGRHVLRRDPVRYDLIISDLFTPWEAGTGNLYTLEHYRLAAQRLEPGGLFVQWIPAYQVSEKEFGIIARTMDEAFAQVLLWRGDLRPAQSVIALVGQVRAQPLDPLVPIRHGRALAGNPELPSDLLAAVSLRFYAGNITASQRFRHMPLNTDNFPRIEYQAPRTQRQVQAGRARWLTGDQLGLLYARLARSPGWDEDPYLSRLSAREIGYVIAGGSYYKYGVYRQAGRLDQARLFLDDFLERTPFSRAPPIPPPPQTLSGWDEF